MTSPPSKLWLSCFKRRPAAALRLFCFPYAGAGSSIFRNWAEAFLPAVEVCAIQLPGRENRLQEVPFTHLPSLVKALTESLLPYLEIPFAFWGHSMGALISFELARQLRREQKPGPIQLFVSGHQAPQIPSSKPPIHQLPEAAFLDEVRRYRGTPEEVLQNSELMELLLPVLRADFTVAESYVYVPEEPLDCPISAFGGLQDDLVTYDELKEWGKQTYGTFKAHLFPGDHFFVHSARATVLQNISQSIQRLLDKALA